MSQPSLFISHGAPDIVINQTEARKFLERDLPGRLTRPDAIVVASAHFEANRPLVVSDPEPETIHDFGGFPAALYEMAYPAKGDPELAKVVAGMLQDAGTGADLEPKRGFDHGTWTPLMLAFPEADVPVVQVSIDPDRDARYHFQLGRALAPLRERNILVIGSGHITHNLRAIFATMRGGANVGEMPEKVRAFTEWFAEAFVEKAEGRLLNWENEAPFVRENHPTSEHLMPLFFAYGAGGEKAAAERLHSSTQFGFFQSDVWAFS